ncbi:phage tail tape measure protein [Achromobacter mucicolens]|uniref:phage tail tape measure protein n=1 Tax=Achromobacter mucicolens TaxID=1389922 RepID=UPI0022F3BF47|nr:phage tail tape measure protein [Achromobacter mucicolens]WBX91563.1 phage tail tape measure protein [Achromobacter mucicolens]
MALLDALTYIIDADNSKLNKEIDKSEKKTDEFGKSMLTAEGRAGLMEEKIKGTFTRIGAAILATVAASKALETFNNHVQTVEQIRNTSDALGVAIEDVDAFGKAIERMGGDAQGARDSLTDMAESIGEALQDVESGRAKTFKALGISLKDVNGNAKNAVQGMVELAGAVEGMGREQAVFRIKELGITDNRSVELLLKGRQEVERMLRVQKEQGVVTKESAERVRVYSETLAKLKQSAGVATSGIVDWILPAITWFIQKLDSVVSWMNRHDTFVKGFFIGLTTILTAMFLPAVVSATAAVWALIAPFLAVAAPIAAVVALFALLYDDVMNFLDGNDSLIGQISEKYPIVGETVKAMAEAVKAAFKWVVDAISTSWEVIKGFPDKVVGAFSSMGASIRDIFDGIVKVVRGAWEYVGSVFDSVSAVIKKIGKWLGFGGDDDVQITTTSVSKGVANAEATAAENKRAAESAEAAAVEGKRVAESPEEADLPAVQNDPRWRRGARPKAESSRTEFAPPQPAAQSREPMRQVEANPIHAEGQMAESVNAARVSLDTAAANPVNSITSNAISNASNTHNETNVQVGQVTVQTQATDAQGISQSIGSELKDQLKNVQADSATGMGR